MKKETILVGELKADGSKAVHAVEVPAEPAPKTRRQSSSNKNDYMTPDWLIEVIERIEPIGLDPCAAVDPKYHFARNNWTGPDAGGFDGLKGDWLRGAGLNFCNPPYGKDAKGGGLINAWAEKACTESYLGAEIVLLLPGYLERAWWNKILYPVMDTTCYLNRRVNFIDPARGAKPWRGSGWFPSVVVYLGDRAKVFERAFAGQGFFIRPIGR